MADDRFNELLAQEPTNMDVPGPYQKKHQARDENKSQLFESKSQLFDFNESDPFPSIDLSDELRDFGKKEKEVTDVKAEVFEDLTALAILMWLLGPI